MPHFEQLFQKMINETGFFHDRYYFNFHRLYKYTMELLYDGYQIPDRYIIVENRILHQFPKVYKKLGVRGDFDLIRKLLKLNRNGFLENNAEYAMAGAAKVGNISILRWMQKNNYPLCALATTYAVKGNQFKTLKWLIRQDCKISDMAVSYAAKKGHMDILKFLIFDIKCIPYDAGYIAASAGQFECVKFLHFVDPTSIFEVCEGAIRAGNLEILKFAYAHGQHTSHNFSCTNVNILIWLFDNGHIQSDINISKKIAWCGNLECLRFLYHNKFPILDKDVFNRAVKSQNIEMIRWLHSLNCPFSKSATKAAVGMCNYNSETRGSLTILKLLISWGCPLDDEVCLLAAYQGDLEMLQFLYEMGCSLNEIVLQRAATNGHLHIIIWARAQGCEWNASVCSNAVGWYHLDVLKWLRGIDRDKYEIYSNESEICPWNEQVCLFAIRYGHIDILKFAIENSCPCGEISYEAALETENIEIINYVMEHYLLNKI